MNEKVDIPKRIQGLVKYAGRVGFTQMRKDLMRHGFSSDSATKIAGAMKALANKAGWLAPEHAYGKQHESARCPICNFDAEAFEEELKPPRWIKSPEDIALWKYCNIKLGDAAGYAGIVAYFKKAKTKYGALQRDQHPELLKNLMTQTSS